MNRSAIDLWVGIFVTIGLGAILFLGLKVGNLLRGGQPQFWPDVPNDRQGHGTSSSTI